MKFEYYSNYAYQRELKTKYFKRASLETRTLRRNEAKYVSRSNICNVCFVARSVIDNECNCS